MSVSERSLANLRPFSGADDPRRGRGPKPNHSIVADLRKELQKHAPGTQIRQRELVAWKILQMALSGDAAYTKMLLEYTVGKPKETVEIERAVEHRPTIDAVRRAIGISDEES